MDKLYIKSQIAMRQREFPTRLIPRDKIPDSNSEKITILPGVRRCGKTSQMEMAANRLISEGVARERLLWISFDDERLVKMTSDDLQLINEAYCEMFPEQDLKDVYMFFDEIQLVDGWEYFVMRLYKHCTKHIFISGSNATMLSTELKSALRGWPVEEETLPLSLREYCRFRNIDTNSWLQQDIAKARNAFFDYNNEGGFPEVTLATNASDKTRILQAYFDSMLLKDLGEHYGIANIRVLRYFLKRIMANLSKPTAIRTLHNDIKSQGLKVSKDTLYDWADYACNIFLFIRIPNYSRSLQKIENSLPKYYCIDNGLRNAVLLPQSNDDGKKLENTVLLQLYRQRTPSQQLFYYQGRGECDFVVRQGAEITQLLQVTWDMAETTTRQREINGLTEAAQATGCRNLWIITADTAEDISTDSGLNIHVIPAWRWLLSI